MLASFAILLAAQAAAVEVRRWPAPEARQGVAAGRSSFYAIDNSTVGRYDKRSGRKLALWQADPAKYPHINSCVVEGPLLVCANSNYPAVPMRSSVVWLDAKTLKPVRERDLGAGLGSLTWLDWHDGAWWACFAHYDGKGGEPGRDHTATRLVAYTKAFEVAAIYRFPPDILARFSPSSSSGGQWRSNNHLYVTGHDRPELYKLALPKAGGDMLRHVGTVITPTAGQAISFDPTDATLLWSIDRTARQTVASRLPKSF